MMVRMINQGNLIPIICVVHSIDIRDRIFGSSAARFVVKDEGKSTESRVLQWLMVMMEHRRQRERKALAGQGSEWSRSNANVCTV